MALPDWTLRCGCGLDPFVVPGDRMFAVCRCGRMHYRPLDPGVPPDGLILQMRAALAHAAGALAAMTPAQRPALREVIRSLTDFVASCNARLAQLNAAAAAGDPPTV